MEGLQGLEVPPCGTLRTMAPQSRRLRSRTLAVWLGVCACTSEAEPGARAEVPDAAVDAQPAVGPDAAPRRDAETTTDLDLGPRDAATPAPDADRMDAGLDGALDALVAPMDAAPPRPDAVAPPVDAAVEDCLSGLDDDGDGLADCDDPQCFLAAHCLPVPEVCDDARDNDLDGRVDCCDPECEGTAVCPPSERPAYTVEELQGHLETWCAACHMGEQRQSGLNLDPPFLEATLGVPSAQVPEVALIEAGDRTRSFFWLKVAGRQHEVGGGFGDMPPGRGLCADEIDRMGAFIDALPR